MMPGIGLLTWIDPAQVFKPSLKNYFTLGVQRCRNAFSGLVGRPKIKLISAKIEVVLNKPQPGLNEKEAVRVKMAKDCLTALVNGEDTLCDKLNRLHGLAAETVGETNVKTALISATESISKDGLILLRDRTAHAYRLLGEKARTGVEGHVLRTL